jgi:uncharacterized protein (TIGR01777 family)
MPSRTIIISGASGLIGSAAAASLAAAGWSIRRLVRSRPSSGSDVHWNPATGELDAAALDGVDAVLHLAGEPVSERWTAAHKRAIMDSRVQGTRLLATTIARLAAPPSVFVSASAVGIYGDGQDRELDETSPAGTDFLAQVSVAWEAESQAAAHATRVVNPRFGVVLSSRGGALAKLLPPFQLGGGGRLGSGKQWMSWISLTDTIAALHRLLETASLRGAVNLVAPNPETNETFGRTLGHVLGRPALLHAPAFMVRAMFGEMADVMLLAGQKVRPRRLADSGFQYHHPTLEAALRAELGRER